MPSCSFLKCGARKNKNLPKLTLHRFPKSEKLKEKWLETIGKKNINPGHKERYICSLHFEDSCFNKTLDVMRLRDDSVPTIFSVSGRKQSQKSSENKRKVHSRSSLSVTTDFKLV